MAQSWPDAAWRRRWDGSGLWRARCARRGGAVGEGVPRALHVHDHAAIGHQLSPPLIVEHGDALAHCVGHRGSLQVHGLAPGGAARLPAAAAVALPAARRHARSALQSKIKPPGDGDEGDGVHHKPRSASHTRDTESAPKMAVFGPAFSVSTSVQLSHISGVTTVTTTCKVRSAQNCKNLQPPPTPRTTLSRKQGRPRAHTMTFTHSPLPAGRSVCTLSSFSMAPHTDHRGVVLWTLVAAARPLVRQPPPLK